MQRPAKPCTRVQIPARAPFQITNIQLKINVKILQKIFLEFLFRLVSLIIIGIIAMFLLEAMYYGFDFSKSLIVFILTAVPLILLDTINREKLLITHFDKDPKLIISIAWFITLLLSFIMFELGLYLVYCDGMFNNLYQRVCW